MRMTPVERFWAKVEIPDRYGCWIWTASVNENGYGKFWLNSQSIVYAHRLSYEIAFGSIPDGLQIDHICHNRRCVNPSHLRLANSQCNNRNGGIRSDNKSGFRGVSFCKFANKWRAFMTINGKGINLGSFDTPEAAADAYEAETRRVYGEFANPVRKPQGLAEQLKGAE